MQYTELQDEIKSAMKAGDTIRRDILRMVLNEVKNIEVNERREITDSDVDAMLKRVIKQTGETLEASEKVGTDDNRTNTLAAQVAILKEYLPKQIEGVELEAMIDEVIASVGAETKKDMGKVMGELGKRTGGNFDKAGAAQIVGQKLS